MPRKYRAVFNVEASITVLVTLDPDDPRDAFVMEMDDELAEEDLAAERAHEAAEQVLAGLAPFDVDGQRVFLDVSLDGVGADRVEVAQ